MTDTKANKTAKSPRWLALTVALLVPAAFAMAFWRTTPAVGGWSQGNGGEQASQGGVDYSQNGRLPIGAASTDGRSLFLQNCAACHGQNLQGGLGPALKRANWPFGQDRDLLIKVIHQGKGLSMPAFDGRLNNQQIAAIAGYLQKENGAE
jgi:mono/diheme cytochrome c family protein